MRSDTGTGDDSKSANMLTTNADRWLDAIGERTSRRRFLPEPVDTDLLDALEALCESFRPFGEARTILLREPGLDLFTGIVGSYGKVTGAQHVLVFIGGTDPLSDARVGYTGEAAVLEATALGLNTCWVGGFFKASRVSALVDLGPDERVWAISPVGHASDKRSGQESAMRMLAGSDNRKALAEIAPGWESWPAWAQAAVHAARRAPSAMNRQPWRFSFGDDGLALAASPGPDTPRVTKRLDCGIAMLHAQVAATATGHPGAWSEAEAGGSVVARYRCASDAGYAR